MSANLKLLAPTHAATWTDEDIKELSEDNRRLAMEMVVQKYRDRLFYHAVYIVKDWEEAYDAIQEVFIRAIREKRFFNEDFRIKAWLYRVTSNLCFNLVRNRKRRGAILESVPRDESSAPDQIERVFASERQSEVMAAIELMTTAHKEILLLRYYNDLSYAEISSVLDIKLGTVMSRLSRARCRLLEVMEGNTEMRAF
ncbi:MAG: RNA polymerase sigma factor [Myxococcota bacterium]|nr:RNA polymerase sigma factor [Myxococcota bacterium]